MKHSYHNTIRSKYYRLLRKFHTLIKSGSFYKLKINKQQQLIKRLRRLHTRLERLGLHNGKLALLTSLSVIIGLTAEAQTFNIFRNEEDINPFGIALNLTEAAPIFVDIDRDGDFDLFSGSDDGTIFFQENIGSSTEPSFDSQLTNPFKIDIEDHYITPSFADIDGDGDLDLFCGGGEGYIHFQENTGTATAAYFDVAVSQPFGLATETESFGDTKFITYSAYLINGICAPTFGDIDLDGDLDAFIGDQDGDIHFFENIGTSTSASFAHNDDPWLNLLASNSTIGIDTLDGETTPQLCDIDGDGDIDMLIGGATGQTFIGYNAGYTSGESTLNSISFVPLDIFNIGDVGTYSHPALVDIDGDGDLDLFVGDYKGEVHFFPGRFYNGIGLLSDQASTAPFGATRTAGANSTFVDIDSDGDADMFFIGGDEIFFSENIGNRQEASFDTPNSNDFELGFQTNTASISFGGESGHIAFIDIDDDGDLDAFIQGNYYNEVRMLENQGSPESALFELDDIIEDPYGILLPHDSDFNFADIDNDGDEDLIYRRLNTVFLLDNDGTGSAPFAGTADTLFTAAHKITGTPQLVDLDFDGDFDIVLGSLNEVDYDYHTYINRISDSESITSPDFISSNNLISLVASSNLTNPRNLSFVDIDFDGDLDLFATNNGTAVYFLKNTNCAYTLYINHFMPHRSLLTSYYSLSSVGQVPPGRDIILEAEGEINMNLGFEVKYDTIGTTENPTLEARIGGCEEAALFYGGGGETSFMSDTEKSRELKSNHDKSLPTFLSRVRHSQPNKKSTKGPSRGEIRKAKSQFFEAQNNGR